MKRTTIMMDEETYERLKAIARRRGVTTSAAIREAVGGYVSAHLADSTHPLERLIGLVDGPEEPLAIQSGEIVAEAVEAKFGELGTDALSEAKPGSEPDAV